MSHIWKTRNSKMLDLWYTCAIFSHWSTSVLGCGVKPVLDKAKTLDPTRHLPEPECYFLPCLWHHTFEANRKWYACNFYRESCGPHISRIRERERHLGTPCHRQNVATRIQSLHMLGGVWGGEERKESLDRGQKQDLPRVETSSAPVAPSGGAASHCPGPPLSYRVAKSSEEKHRFAVQKGSLEVRERTHTYTHEGFQAFCLFFFNNFSVVFFYTYMI